VFLATSAIHRQYKLNMAQEEIIRTAVEGVKIARDLAEDVEFSPEDASRTELDFLTQVVEAVIEAGATTVNIPDTVGYTVPDEFAELFRYLRKNVRGIDKIRLSVHCHDDLGMAVANSLTAVVAGARQIECTINGIGERAGNCSLEEVVMALKTRDAFFNLDTGIDTTRLYPTSRMLANIVGVPIPRNKAIVGENAFAHESGIHQHGMLKHHSTYEIMRPQDVGLSRSSLVLGKHSGRHALRDRVKELGFELDDVEFARVFEEFKALADKKKELYDGDIEALVLQAEHSAAGPWSLMNLKTSSDAKAADATVRLRNSDGREIEMRATGDGPVDAALKAIERATGVQVVLRKFEVRSVSAGEDAQGEALVYVEYNQRTYRGSSVSTNIVESATQAFLEVINRIELASATLARTRIAQAAV
jgi:2-isopropylmalate synthase